MKQHSNLLPAPHLRGPKTKRNYGPLLPDSPQPVWVLDAESLRFLDVNQAATEAYGYSRAEFLAMRLFDVIADEGSAYAKKKVHSTKTKGKNYSGEARHARKDGSIIHVKVTSQPVSFEGHPVERMVIEEIADYQTAPEITVSTLGYASKVIIASPVGILTCKASGEVVSLNPAAEKMIGGTAKSIRGQNFRELLSWKESGMLEAADAALRTRQEQKVEVHGTSTFGKKFWFSAQFIPFDYDGEGHLLVLLTDITEQRLAEQALRQIEDTHRDLLDNSRVLICTHDLQGNLLSINSWVTLTLGYDAEQLIGRNIQDFLVPEMRPGFQKYLLSIAKHGSADGLMHVLTATGQRRVWEFHNTLRTEDVAEPIVRGTAFDITERRMAEDALRESESLYRELFNNALEGIFRSTPDGQLVSANPALVHMLGYESEDELLSLNIREFYLEPRLREQNIKKIQESGQLRDSEIHLRRRDGGTLIAVENSRAIRDATGRVILYEGTLTDISERKRIEEALRASESELQALFGAVPDLVLVLDKDGRYLKIAPGHADMLAAPSEGLLGKTFHQVFSQQKADEFVGFIHQALETRRPVQFEYALLIAAQIRWFSGAAAPLTEDSVVWVARDITPQKRAEEQIQRRLLELEALYDSGLALGQTLDPKQIGKKIIEVLSNRLNWHHAAVRVRRADTEEVELLAFSETAGEDADSSEGYTLASNAITRVGQGMAGWAMQHGRILNSGDLPKDPRYHATFPSMLSGLYAPIWAGGRVLGCITVETDQREAFTEADELLLTTLASQAAAALENARLFAEKQQRVSESLTLYEFTRDLTAQSDLATLLQTLAERAAALLNVPGGAVYLRDEQRGDLEIVTATDESLPLGTRLEMGQGMAGRVAETREALIVDDYRIWEGRPAQFADRSWAAVLEVPMLYRGELIGVLVAYLRHDRENTAGAQNRKFSEDDIRLLSLFAASAAGAIYSTRLFDAERLRREEAETLRAAAVRSAERLSTLHAATREIAQISQHPEQVYASIHQAASRLMPTEAFTITLVDDERRQIRGVYLFDRNGRSPSVDIPFGQSFSSHVILSGETVLLKDVEAADINRVHFGSPDHVRSVLAVPLRVGEQIIGAISAQSYLPDIYQPEDQVLLEMLAAQAAIAIQNARLFQETSKRAQEFKALYESAYLLPLQQDTAALVELLVVRATELLHAPRGSVYLFDPEQSLLFPAARSGVAIGFEPRLKLGEGAAGRVALTREPLIIDDYETWEGRSAQYEGVPFRAVLEVPMLYGDELIGVLSVAEYGESSTRKFNEEEARLLSLFATQAAGAIYNARLLEDTRRRLHELESLTRVGEALTGTLEFEPLLENILRTARQAIPAAEKGTILLRGEAEQSHLHVRAQVGYEDPRLQEIPFDDQKGYAGRAFHEKRPFLVRDSIAEYELPFSGQFSEVNVVQSAIVAPLIVKDQAIGAIALDNASRTSAFDEADLRLLVLFASSAAVVIENARLFGETRRRAQEFEVLYEATREIGSNQQDLPSLLSTLVEKAAHLLGSYGSGMYLYDAARGDLDLVVVSKGQAGVGERVMLGDGAAGRVAQTRMPLVIDDYKTWEGRRPMLDGTPYRALLQVPMIYGGDLIGVLDVYEYGDGDQSERKFNEADVKLLMLFASHAAGAVHSARLFEETRRKAAQFSRLYETARDLADQRNLTQLLETIVDRAGGLLKAPVSGIYLYDKARNDLSVAVNRGLTTSLGIRLALGEGVAGRVAQSRQPLIIEDYQKWEGRSNQYNDVPLRSVLEVPMLYSGELIGVLTVDEIGDSERKFTQDDADLLSLFASYAASAVHTARLFEQSSKRAGEFQALYQTAADLSAQTDLQTLLNTVIQRARDLMGAAGSDVYLMDPHAGNLELAAANDPDHQPGTHLALGEGISGRVAETKQALIVNDYRTWEGRSLRYEGLPYTSAIGIPMLYSGQLIGVLTAYNRADPGRENVGRAFTAEDASLLELLANAAAGAVYVARLLEQTRRRVEQLSALHAVDTAIGSTTDLRVSLQAVLESVIHQLGADAADVLLLNASTLTLQYSAGSGFFTSEINRTSSSIGLGRAGKAALERQMVEVPDLTAPNGGFLRSNLVAVERFKSYVAVPLIAKGEVKGVLEIFQRTPRELDEERKSLLEVLAGQAALAIDNARLFEGLEKANLELTMAYDATIEGWSQALELRDQETQGHSSRVVDLTLRMAATMGIPDRQLRDIRRGVLLHDIGKMGIPDAILHKPGPLTPEEWQVMRQHPQYAYNMLAPIIYLRNSLDIPYSHHEKWDGTGYPRGLKAETIPLPARIFCIIDVYDALTSNRPYRGAWSKEKAIEYILEQSGKHFDPHVVQAFIELIGN